MYSTCLFCNRSLGANEAIEQFPVGRRLAFDSAKGRLWAVCRGCGRWNLSPLDERWEAIEACERAFEGTRLRASSDQIGLARLSEGLELVRIGAPLRPEFAAWRYGDQFGKRRQRMFIRGTVLAGVLGVTTVGVLTGGFGLFAAGALPGGQLLYQVPNRVQNIRRARIVVARGTKEDGTEFTLRGKHLGKAELVDRAGELRLRFQHDAGRDEIGGAEAMRVGGLVLARLNANGAGRSQVEKAVAKIEDAGGPATLLERSARVGERPPPRKRHWSEWDGRRDRHALPGGLKATDAVSRLALEMALNEENERRALQGELATLAEEWKSAEEIARISDDMFLPDDVNERLGELKDAESHRGEPKRLIATDDR